MVRGLWHTFVSYHYWMGFNGVSCNCIFHRYLDRQCILPEIYNVYRFHFSSLFKAGEHRMNSSCPSNGETQSGKRDATQYTNENCRIMAPLKTDQSLSVTIIIVVSSISCQNNNNNNLTVLFSAVRFHSQNMLRHYFQTNKN